MGLITSVLGGTIGKLLVSRPYWAVKLRTGQWCTELDLVRDGTHPQGERPFDWTIDLVNNGDILKMKELWLFCPPNQVSPLGNTAHLPITEPGTAFQFKVGAIDVLGAWGRNFEAQIIGRVDDKATGECTCFTWDERHHVLSTPWHSNVYDFYAGRVEGRMHLGKLALDVLGVRLG